MNIVTRLDDIHKRAKANKWFRYFAVFNRIALAAGFIPSGLTKLFDERFTTLSVNHPMGNYLEALYHTSYYYPFIGFVQVTAAILLLIPRTATLGAVIYFPVILNICILSLAVGFDGSLVTSPLMVLANLYLLAWDYDKLKFILPFKYSKKEIDNSSELIVDNKFPKAFFLGVVATVGLTVFVVYNSYNKKTRNTFKDCYNDCKNSDDTQECFDFCDCIHNQGKSLSVCSEELRKAKEK
ncbi:MAG: DoxX family protein [Lewinellaceae bacterium]|nr:DoxX family protein [Lewinellaceae bacterium]